MLKRPRVMQLRFPVNQTHSRQNWVKMNAQFQSDSESRAT